MTRGCVNVSVINCTLHSIKIWISISSESVRMSVCLSTSWMPLLNLNLTFPSSCFHNNLWRLSHILSLSSIQQNRRLNQCCCGFCCVVDCCYFLLVCLLTCYTMQSGVLIVLRKNSIYFIPFYSMCHQSVNTAAILMKSLISVTWNCQILHNLYILYLESCTLVRPPHNSLSFWSMLYNIFWFMECVLCFSVCLSYRLL